MSTEIWKSMLALNDTLLQAKPEERSDLSRSYAITITELEKLMGYFYTAVILQQPLYTRRQDDLGKSE